MPLDTAARLACKIDVPYVISPRGMLVKDLVRRKSRWLKSAWIALIEYQALLVRGRSGVQGEAKQ